MKGKRCTTGGLKIGVRNSLAQVRASSQYLPVMETVGGFIGKGKIFCKEIWEHIWLPLHL